MELKPVTREEMYLAAILDELKALRGDLQRLLPPTPTVYATNDGGGYAVELKEPERKPKPKRKG